jgi:imidazolonepropionase-like amidohydrolase
MPGAAQAQDTVTIKAARILDGRGGTLTNAAIVVQGTKIVRIDPNPGKVTYDLGDMTVMSAAWRCGRRWGR